jgi:hypothetical protein
MTRVLDDCRTILATGGYEVATQKFDGTPVLLAETLYALVMVVVVPDEDVDRFVEEAQARLTQLAATHPSPRRWDLYLVLVVDADPRRYHAVRERFESDTRYARKLVVTSDHDGRLEQLLRPLLPLRPLPDIALAAPLAAVHRQLLVEGVESGLADAAVKSFSDTGEVNVA